MVAETGVATDAQNPVLFSTVVDYLGFSDVNGIVAAFGGDHIEWWDSNSSVFANIAACKYTGVVPTTKAWVDLTYKQSYDMIADMRHESYPWLVDVLVNTGDNGATLTAAGIGEFVFNWIYDDAAAATWDTAQPADWHTYENRIIPTFSKTPTEQQVRDYAIEETEKATKLFENVETYLEGDGELDTFSWDEDTNSTEIKYVTDIYDRITRLWPLYTQ